MHAAAKVVSVLMIVMIFMPFSTVWADEKSKAAKLQELMELSGMMQIMAEARAKNRTQALQAKETLRKQLRTDFLKDDPEIWDFFDTEYQKFVDSMAPEWTAEEAVQKYVDLYGAKMTEKEIDIVLEFSRSPVGKKYTAVSDEVAPVWFDYLYKESEAQFHEGLQTFVSSLKTFMDEKKKSKNFPEKK